MPDFSYTALAKSGIKNTGTLTAATEREVAAMLDAKGLFPIQISAARDAGLKSQKAWAVRYYPTYAVVDRKGIVRAVGLQPDHVETVVKKLLAEPAP